MRGIFALPMLRVRAHFLCLTLFAFAVLQEISGQEPCGSVADFLVVNSGGCADAPVSFDVTGPNPDWTYAWDFGDGVVSDEFQPSHVFQNALGEGTLEFEVSLTVFAGASGPGGLAGCTTAQTVSVLALPDPGLSDLSAICLGQDGFPGFDLPASTFAAPGVASWSVDWGNGTDTTFSGFNPVLDTVGTMYPDYGLFGITIQVQGTNGCVNGVADSLFVGTNPTIGSALPGNSVTVCSPYELTFPLLETDNNLLGTEYSVSFGDGEGLNFMHPPPSEVSHTYLSSSCFSSTPGGENYAFAVTFTASNLCGNATNIVEPVRIHQSPSPDMFGIGDVCAGPTFTYDAQGSGLIATPTYCVPAYGEWNVVPEQGQADASPAAGTDFEFNTVFPEPGEYTVYFTESHPNCQDSTGAIAVCVYPDPVEAIGTVAPTSGCAPFTIQWENLTPDPELCGQWDVQWVVSGTSGGPDPDWQPESSGVTFLNHGQYTVTLEIGVPGPARSDCVVASSTWYVNVNEPGSVDFEFLGENHCAGDVVQTEWVELVTPGYTFANGWTIDGSNVQTATTQPLNYVFDQPGNYEVVYY